VFDLHTHITFTIKMHVRPADSRKSVRQKWPRILSEGRLWFCSVQSSFFFHQNQKSYRKYSVCMYVCMLQQITTKLLWSIDNAFILSKNNELTLNGIYILNYSAPFKNSIVRKVYKFNSQFQGKFQTIFDLVNGKLVNTGFSLFDGEFKGRSFSKRGINTGR
jgi:hypothetical protein